MKFEMLVFAEDKVHPELRIDVQCPKRGHVIAIMPAGHPWGKAERQAPFTIIEVEAESEKALEGYLAWETEDPAHLHKLLQHRSHKFDLDAHASRHGGKPIKQHEALALAVKMPMIHDPDVLA